MLFTMWTWVVPMNHVLNNAWILPRTRRATFSTYSTLFARVQQELFVLWLPVYRLTVYKLAVYLFLFKHQRQRAQATYMPIKSSTMVHVEQ